MMIKVIKNIYERRIKKNDNIFGLLAQVHYICEVIQIGYGS